MAKISKYPQGSIWSSEKEGRTIYFAEIGYLGKRYKHKGSPHRETVEKWLETKRECIRALADEKRALHEKLAGEKKETIVEMREPTVRRQGYKGTIYSYVSHRLGKESIKHVAEVQCRGRKIRKCSNDKDSLQLWLDQVIKNLNEICQDTDNAIMANYASYVKEERRLKSMEITSIESYLSSFGLKITAETDKQDRHKRDSYKGTYTYILQDGSTSMFKIGKTKNLKQRLANFCNNAYHYRYIHLGDMEKKLHKLLEHRRLTGEWFDLSDDILASLKEDYVLIDVGD